jgi:hypothetical protein
VALRAGLGEVLAWLAAAEGQGAGLAAMGGTTAAESEPALPNTRSEEDE